MRKTLEYPPCMKISELKTGRLLLRQWVGQDLSVFTELNSDPETMGFFPALLSREESNDVAEVLPHS